MKKLVCREVWMSGVIEFYEEIHIDKDDDMTYYLVRFINRNACPIITEKRFNLRSGEEKPVRGLVRTLELVLKRANLYINPRIEASPILSFINQVYPLHMLNKRAIVKMIESIREEGR